MGLGCGNPQAIAALREGETVLDAGLPDAYGPDVFGVKAHLVYQHVFEQYWGDGRSVYADVA